MSTAYDFTKEQKELYNSGKKPVIVTVPPLWYAMVDGLGEPGGDAYKEALSLLYSISYTIKMSKMKGQQPDGYFEYKVPPLEGLWEASLDELPKERSQWRWTSMIRQPDFVTPQVFQRFLAVAADKNPALDYSKLRFASYNEGLCVQCIHLGPFATEPATIRAMDAFALENSWQKADDPARRHHEIYLSDPRKTVPERMKTLLRTPLVKPE